MPNHKAHHDMSYFQPIRQRVKALDESAVLMYMSMGAEIHENGIERSLFLCDMLMGTVYHGVLHSLHNRGLLTRYVDPLTHASVYKKA